jgi:hypothetical protein
VGAVKRASLALLLLLSLAAQADSTLTCDAPRDGAEVCRYANHVIGRTSQWRDGQEVGPRKTFRQEDGSVERIEHLRPNAGPYATLETYYETGGIRKVELKKGSEMIGIEYTVSGKIYRVWCLPGQAGRSSGGYSYTLRECQLRAPFNLAEWKPSK